MRGKQIAGLTLQSYITKPQSCITSQLAALVCSVASAVVGVVASQPKHRLSSQIQIQHEKASDDVARPHGAVLMWRARVAGRPPAQKPNMEPKMLEA